MNEMETDSTQVLKSPRPSRMKSLLAWVAILGLAALVVWFASERNARFYYLVPEDGQLIVKKGMLLPAGKEAVKGDPALVEIYGPLTPPAGVALPPEQAFDGQAGLEQALYGLLAGWARQDVMSEKPELLARGLGYIARAEKLTLISESQHQDLRALRAESGFYEARGLIQRGTEELRQAREKLRLASEMPTHHAGDAAELLRRLDPLVEDALGVSREVAGSPRPSPGASSPTAAPAPQNPPAPPASAESPGK